MVYSFFKLWNFFLGINYTIGRVPIASCDFSTKEYSYLEREKDFFLNYFKLTNEDFELKVCLFLLIFID